MSVSSRERKKQIKRTGTSRSAGERRSGRRLVILALVAIAVAAGVMLQQRGTSPGADADTGVRSSERAARSLTADRTKDAERLVGRWLRSDAAYVIDVRAVGADGRADARYFNPQPINVSRATVGEGEGG